MAKKEEEKEEIKEPQQQDKLSQRTDYKLVEKEEETPKFGLVIELDDDQKTDLFEKIRVEMEVIENQRRDQRIDENAASYRNQYWGEVAPKSMPYANSFNIHVHLTMKHTNQIELRTKQAFFDSDPIWSVSPRPGKAKQEGFKIAKQKEEFLDYASDVEMRTRDNMSQTFHEWTLLGVGYIKLPWVSRIERIADMETYDGSKDKELERFLDNYDNAEEKYPDLIAKLKNGEKLELYVDYKTPIYNAPLPTYVKYEDFLIDTRTKGIEGQKTAHLQAEKLHYTWFDLQTKVNEDFFEQDDIEYLKFVIDKKGKKTDDVSGDYLSREYDIRECLFHYKLPDAEEETKIVVWLDYEKKKILRVIHFPYWHRRPYWIPFFLTKKKAGWYQPGTGYILRDGNIVANAIMNFMLDIAFIQNLILFKVKKDSEMWRLMVSRKWYPGFPIGYENDPNEIEQFQLQKQDLNGLLGLFQVNQKMGEEALGLTTYMTGKESPTDPTAPATKTLALMKESNINIKEYISNALPSMNEMAYQTMELFYQFSEEGREYRVLGKNEAFNKIPREALRYRTDYQSQAYGFDFDRMNEAKVGLALFNMFGDDPEITQNPMGRYNFIYEIFKQMGSNWDKKVDKIMLSPEEREKYQIKLLKEAIGKYVEEKRKATEQKAKRDARKQELMASGASAEEIVQTLNQEFPPQAERPIAEGREVGRPI